MRVAALAMMLSAAIWPAMARGDDVLSVPPNKCLTLEIIKQRVAVYPGFEITEYDARQSSAIRQGLIRAGAEMSLLDHWFFIGLTASGNSNVLVIGFNEGCFEGVRRVPSEQFGAWLVGETAEGMI